MAESIRLSREPEQVEKLRELVRESGAMDNATLDALSDEELVVRVEQAIAAFAEVGRQLQQAVIDAGNAVAAAFKSVPEMAAEDNPYLTHSYSGPAQRMVRKWPDADAWEVDWEQPAEGISGAFHVIQTKYDSSVVVDNGESASAYGRWLILAHDWADFAEERA